VVEQATVSTAGWIWTPPVRDFTGYLVEVSRNVDGIETVLCNTAVDVSSDWTRFPRYGFLHDYGTKSRAETDELMKRLARYHINALQYYDWLWAHHKPLAGTPAAPRDEWPDLMGRTIHKSTVEGFIDAGHSRNIASMWYDLCVGALDTWREDGVSLEWFVFNSSAHSEADINMHRLDSPPFRSSIYVVDPSNGGWLDYFSERIRDVYSVFDFDGYHIDQLGSRGMVYDYGGKRIDLPGGYEVFLRRIKTEFPNRKHAFNAVSRWGQPNIAAAGPDFFYNEVWDTDNFSDFSDVIFENLRLDPDRNSVVAAYVNYEVRESDGYINTPGVLLGNAALFALGGSRIELGEHMLTSEYFPHSRLKMDGKLQAALVRYYDFLTAYENLLRDGGSFGTPEMDVVSTDGSHIVGIWPPKQGEITTLCKSVGKRQVVHLLNFANASTLDPRDAVGIQREPQLLKTLKITVGTDTTVSKVWVATPDATGKMYEEVPFSQGDGKVTVTVPALEYWTMVVLEK
jgi:dextranase